jgi:hypothetical protein
MRQADGAPAVAAAPIRPRASRGREGFFRAGTDDTGRWWLFDPQGSRFFFRGVHGVRVAGAAGESGLPQDAAARLRAWGFNALALTDHSSLHDDGLPFLISAKLSDAGRVLVGPGLRLPDVFDPQWAGQAATRARQVCLPFCERRDLIGWVTDDQLEWANFSPAGRPSLLQLCLSLEPGFAAYHAAWEFVLAHHGGRLASLAHAWNASLPNKEVVRELTRAEEGLGTRGYLRDDARWTQEFARRYFNTTAMAVRQADSNHLVFGCRFRGAPPPGVVAELVYPAIDVSMRHWTELPVSGASHPALADNVNWTTGDFLRWGAGRRTRRLTTFEHMLRKARAALDRAARHPGIVGYAWQRWEDEPGEQPPFASGVMHVNGMEAREHTELLAQFNLRAENLHRATGRA